LSEKAIDIISNNSFRQIKQWKEANPDYITNEDKKQEYILLMKQLIVKIEKWTKMQKKSSKIYQKQPR
jgi:hypothetical protein